jgi:hypothetical protein
VEGKRRRDGRVVGYSFEGEGFLGVEGEGGEGLGGVCGGGEGCSVCGYICRLCLRFIRKRCFRLGFEG